MKFLFVLFSFLFFSLPLKASGSLEFMEKALLSFKTLGPPDEFQRGVLFHYEGEELSLFDLTCLFQKVRKVNAKPLLKRTPLPKDEQEQVSRLRGFFQCFSSHFQILVNKGSLREQEELSEENLRKWVSKSVEASLHEWFEVLSVDSWQNLKRSIDKLWGKHCRPCRLDFSACTEEELRSHHVTAPLFMPVAEE